MTAWPGRSPNGAAARWPGRAHPPVEVEPPAWFRAFVVDDWVRPGDDQVRHPAGALMGVEEVARRRHLDACREWARANGFDVVDWLVERRRIRLGREGFGVDTP